MADYSMIPNIIEHSFQVMNVSLAITDNLKNGVQINRDMIIAAALLHDITKTQSIETRERHDLSGGILLRELGFASIAAIVEQHVDFQNFNPQGKLEEREIVFYADKRVMHDRIVGTREREADLLRRYGTTEERRRMIIHLFSPVYAMEKKIAGFMKEDIDTAIGCSPGLKKDFVEQP
jgi:putative nucleotidyltransferase with HDIG domain